MYTILKINNNYGYKGFEANELKQTYAELSILNIQFIISKNINSKKIDFNQF